MSQVLLGHVMVSSLHKVLNTRVYANPWATALLWGRKRARISQDIKEDLKMAKILDNFQDTLK